MDKKDNNLSSDLLDESKDVDSVSESDKLSNLGDELVQSSIDHVTESLTQITLNANEVDPSAAKTPTSPNNDSKKVSFNKSERKKIK